MSRTRVVGLVALGAVLLMGIGPAVAYDDEWDERDDERAADLRGSVLVEMQGLDAYGEWVWVHDHGRGWRPRVEHDWRPYWRGHWAWSGQWVWVSADPWGDLPSHYGEWIWSAREGWVWIPGTEWAPARVVWIVSGPIIAWAPIGIDISIGPDPRFWTYADARAFDGPVVRPHRIPPPAIHLRGRIRNDTARLIVPEPVTPRRELRVIPPRAATRPFDESRRAMTRGLGSNGDVSNGEVDAGAPPSRGRDHGKGRGFERRELR